MYIVASNNDGTWDVYVTANIVRYGKDTHGMYIDRDNKQALLYYDNLHICESLTSVVLKLKELKFM